MIARLARANAAHLFGAFVVMGLWAWFANSGHGTEAALSAAALQGTLSACVTLTLKTFIDKIAPRFAGPAALVLPPLAAFALVGGVLAILHGLNGTPEPLATIALPLAAATAYAAVYSYALWRGRQT